MNINGVTTTKIIFTDSAEVSRAIAKGSVEAGGDTVEISEEARAALEEADKQAQENREESFNKWLADFNAAAASQQSEALEEEAQNLAKIMEIARRIARGDHVPASDEKKLMEYSSELYQMAKQTAMMNQNKDSKEYDSLFEEEEPDCQNETVDIGSPQHFGVEMEITSSNGESSIGEISETELE